MSPLSILFRLHTDPLCSDDNQEELYEAYYPAEEMTELYEELVSEL